MSPAEFWASLSDEARGELGDLLVLGGLDWRDWLSRRPAPGFWRDVDAIRLAWEAR